MEHHRRLKAFSSVRYIRGGGGRLPTALEKGAKNTCKYGVFLSTIIPKLAPLLDAVQGLTQISAGRERR